LRVAPSVSSKVCFLSYELIPFHMVKKWVLFPLPVSSIVIHDKCNSSVSVLKDQPRIGSLLTIL
jgi:hypothetical protein